MDGARQICPQSYVSNCTCLREVRCELVSARQWRHITRQPPSRHRCGEGRVEIAGQAMLQSPSNRDRTVARMPDIGGRTQAPEGSLIGTESSEEHHRCALL